MNDEEIIFFEKSLNNNNNSNISNLTFERINNQKENVIKNLLVNKKENNKLLRLLNDYRYIDEYPDLVEGRYIRWINLTYPDKIKLTNGGILCEIKIDEYISLVMKNNMNRFFKINFDENLIFQKLTDQEKIIVYAMDVINK